MNTPPAFSPPALYERFFRMASDLFCIAGTDGYFKHLSPRWPETLGHTMEDLLSRPFLDFVHPEDREVSKQKASVLATRPGTLFFENRFRRKDGSYRWLQWTVAFDDEAQLFYGVARDITEEKRRAEARMAKAQERFELIAEGAGGVLCDFDITDPSNPFNPAQKIFFSSGLPGMLGYTPEEMPMVLASWIRCLHPEDMPLVEAAVMATIRREVPRYQVEYRLIRKDGSILWVEATGMMKWNEAGEPIRFAGSMRDVSDRKRAELEVQEKVALIERQRDAIRELSIPIIQVWEGVLVVPLMGVFDSGRAAEMMERLLGAVMASRAQCAVLDMTGVDVVDTGTAGYLLQVIKAVGLLGSRCVVTGIRPAVAQTMVALGLELGSLETAANLQHALERMKFGAERGR